MAKHDLPNIEFNVGDARFGIVAARYNVQIVESLLKGALSTLIQHGVSEDKLSVLRVPGAFEIPQAALLLGRRADIDAVITLGCVINGDTPHADYLCSETARGVGEVALRIDKPVIFGVLTTNDLAQAKARAGGEVGNKGAEAALAALEMVSLFRSAQQ